MGGAYLWVEFGTWVGLDYGLGRHFCHSASSLCPPLIGTVEINVFRKDQLHHYVLCCTNQVWRGDQAA